jgi:hypothetical protein
VIRRADTAPIIQSDADMKVLRGCIWRWGSPGHSTPQSSFLRPLVPSSLRRQAYGSCQTYAKRQERVSHRLFARR